MKGKFAETIKKWWMIVLVATLALSLTSCGRKRTRLLSGAIQCAGELGDFDVALYPAGNNQFEVVVLPYEAYADQIAFSIAQSGGSSRSLSTLSFNNAASQEYSVGIITAAELSSGFDSLWLDGYFLNGQEAGALSCDLPMPSGGSNNY